MLSHQTPPLASKLTIHGLLHLFYLLLFAIRSFALSFARSLVRSYVRSFVCSFARSFVLRSFARSLARTFVRSLVRLFVRSFARSPVNRCLSFYPRSQLVKEFTERFPGMSLQNVLSEFSLPAPLSEHNNPLGLPQQQVQTLVHFLTTMPTHILT